MSNLPLVSIIIPCYNAAPRLAACLQSCLDQSYSNLEIIFVDNNSTDNSVEIAHQFQEIASFPFQILHCPEKGANYARNLGFTGAQGQYIQWLDADDELAPDKIALQVGALAGVGAEFIACADWEWHYYQGGKLPFRLDFPQLCWQDTLLQCLINHWHPPHAYLMSRAMAQELHHLQAWYQESPIANDTEYYTTAALIGGRFLPVQGARVRYFTWSQSQLTMSTSYQIRVESMRKMFERLRERICLRPLRSFSGMHWILLRQRWEMWELAPCRMKPLGERDFWIERTEDGVGMTLTAGEARIAMAMSEMQGVAAIDSHAYRILRFLWKQVVLQAGVTPATVEKKLAQWVGLLPDEGEVKGGSNTQLSQEQLAMVSLLNTVPIHAPMFPEIRLTILQFLNKCQAVGLLQQRGLSTASLDERSSASSR